VFSETFELVPTNLESSTITAEMDTNSILTDSDRLTNHRDSRANDVTRDEVVIMLRIDAPVKIIPLFSTGLIATTAAR